MPPLINKHLEAAWLEHIYWYVTILEMDWYLFDQTCPRLTVPNYHPLATSEANQIVITAVFDLEIGVCFLSLMLRHC